MPDNIVSEFRRELEKLLNKHSRENGCNTPDFILAGYLVGCLESFDTAVKAREDWYGRSKKGTLHHDPIAYTYGHPVRLYNPCPECGAASIRTCRCMASDSECVSGHKWHICKEHRVIVKGHSDHGSLEQCSCGKAVPRG